MPDRDKSVFVNCPYDAAYRANFEALVFTVVACGFYPSSARVTGAVAVPRMQRIAEALFAAKYSIHDLSRCRGEGDENLARFNMPLELGIAMGQRYSGDANCNDHDWCLLVPQGHDYRRYLSDLAGYDPLEYDGGRESAVRAVMSWLVVTQDAPLAAPDPPEVLGALDDYGAAMRRLRVAWNPAEVPWPYLAREAVSVARAHGLVPDAQ